ncbi:hypothetical protein IQ276_033795 [Desmonostoc muscorum LEGE 12446]|uniref:Flagellar assembly protein H n=1 Tax=Desmonostoc muscorum LEGE 12446 TaxID=1828758 RepID=A0A8J7D2L2_DESMC|nr:hypothetical protein [Desmonostoc muscorum]MCF2151304.1 hypothetical protein [Desmonostoc muscorum LEGE 12446]
MTRFPYDQFAKDYLEELLQPLGSVQVPRRVAGEVREIDVWFAPDTSQPVTEVSKLGLLGRFATKPAIFEPFRNAATATEICNCLLKLLEIRGEYEREANRNQQRLEESNLPRLWILSPTASQGILDGFAAIVDEENWLTGVYCLPKYLRTAIVAIHQLPRTRETLWLRILGKGKVQQQAIDEIEALPEDEPLRARALELLYSLKITLEVSQNLDTEDRQLIMRLSPLYTQKLAEATEQGVQQGVQQGQRVVVENLLKARFGELDEQLSAIVEPLLSLPPEQFSPLLLQLSQLSREELLTRFAEQP